MKKIAFSLILLAISIFIKIEAQEKDSLIKVTDEIYEITGFFCNISFLVTDDGVILFDTGNYPERAKRIQEIIKSVTDKSITYIIITHYHGDHTNGLAGLPLNVPVIAQRNTLKNLRNSENERIKEIEKIKLEIDSLNHVLSGYNSKTSGNFLKTDSIYKDRTSKKEMLIRTKIIYPTILIDSSKILVSGKDTIELVYPGKAHTDGDLVINIKTRKTIVFGDVLFNKCFPYIDPIGDVKNWYEQLNYFAQTGTKYFIPGHCDLADKSDVLLFSDYLKDLYTKVKKLKEEGKTEEETSKLINLSKYDNFGLTFLKAQNIDAVYNQLK